LFKKQHPLPRISIEGKKIELPSWIILPILQEQRLEVGSVKMLPREKNKSKEGKKKFSPFMHIKRLLLMCFCTKL
jgi:hypothetical protein